MQMRMQHTATARAGSVVGRAVARCSISCTASHWHHQPKQQQRIGLSAVCRSTSTGQAGIAPTAEATPPAVPAAAPAPDTNAAEATPAAAPSPPPAAEAAAATEAAEEPQAAAAPAAAAQPEVAAGPQQPVAAPAPEPPERPPSAQPQFASEEEKFHAAYKAAYTMSQLFVQDRPAAVPLGEWEARRKKRDMEEIGAAAKKRGKDQAAVAANLEALESLLPNLINLHKMKAADWVALSEDVPAAASKLIALKNEFPRADVFAIMAARPKTLLQDEAALLDNARRVKALLGSAAPEAVDAIIQAVPELSDAATLSRSLAFLAASFPGQDPVSLLRDNPQILLNLGESNIEDSAEYGEMTTKD